MVDCSQLCSCRLQHHSSLTMLQSGQTLLTCWMLRTTMMVGHDLLSLCCPCCECAPSHIRSWDFLANNLWQYSQFQLFSRFIWTSLGPIGMAFFWNLQRKRRHWGFQRCNNEVTYAAQQPAVVVALCTPFIACQPCLLCTAPPLLCAAGSGLRLSTLPMLVCTLLASCWSPSRRSTPGSATVISGRWLAV